MALQSPTTTMRPLLIINNNQIISRSIGGPFNVHIANGDNGPHKEENECGAPGLSENDFGFPQEDKI